MDTRALEERLRVRFDQLEDDDWRASCPDRIRARKGVRFRCRVRAPTVVWTMTATQLDADGRRFRLRGKPRFAKSIESPPRGVSLRTTEDLDKEP